MSKICRTCLQKTEVTFSVNQLHEFGESIVKISYVLRLCIPELYLGLSTNPEICYDCKRELETVYLFKRKCLNTELLLGNYLKSVRCTGKSIELHDVLSHINNKEAAETSKENVVNAQDIIAEWEDSPDGDGGNDIDIPLVEVRQSAPNPQASIVGGAKSLCPSKITRYIINNKNKIEYFSVIRAESVNETYTKKSSKQSIKPLEATKMNATDGQDAENDFPKITSVFSLSNVEETAQNDVDLNNTPPELNENADTLAEVKTEPIDIELNRIDFPYNSTDEETLDASETASYENMRCDSALQGIIDSIPAINDGSQYVDIPEFVQINNFGPRELEQLRQQQLQVAQNDADQKKVNFTEIGTQAAEIEPSVLKSILGDKLSATNNAEVQSNTLEDAGNVTAKYVNGYRVVENDPSLWTTSPFEEPSNSAAVSVPVEVKRGRKLRVKSAEYKFSTVGRKNILADTYDDRNYLYDDKNVVVLFTNYTSDGRYVNDHDYLINPYKRNRILIQSDREWLCMCYICNYMHKFNYHVRHMNIHSSICKVCGVDMGTPFMLNGHVRSHVKLCTVCNQRVPYSLIDSHPCKNTTPHSSRRRGRRKSVKEEKPVQPIIQEGEIKDVDTSVVKEQPIEKDAKVEDSVPPSRRGRKRKIKIEECSPSEINCRVLRSMPRKWYSEADVDSCLSLKGVSKSIEPT